MSDVRETQLLVIGGGPGGYPAALHAADHGMKVTLVDEDPKLGGVCLNRGCIPSKALLHTAKIIREAREMAEHGVSFGEPKLDLEKLRDFVQQKVVGKLTGGIAQLTKGRGVEVVKGHATFTDPRTRSRSPARRPRRSSSRTASSRPVRCRSCRSRGNSTTRASWTAPRRFCCRTSRRRCS